MNILITGGAGFIGSFLARQLLWRGDNVIALDNFNDYYPRRCKEFNVDLCNVAIGNEPLWCTKEEIDPVASKLFSYYPESENKDCGKYTFLEVDICDYDKLEDIFAKNQFDAIIHLAAMAGVPKSTKNPRLYTKVNVDGTTNVLDLAVKFGVIKFLFGSSSSVYGNREDCQVCEDDSLFPESVYGATKVAGEKLCYAFHKTFALKVGIIRIFGPIYGPLQRPYGMLVQRAINYAYNEKTLQIYGRNGLDTAKDNTYIDDEVQGFLKSLDAEFEFEVFNIGTSNPVSIRDTLSFIEESLGKKVQATLIKKDKADVVASANISRACRVLDYKPVISTQEGIKRQVELFLLMPKWYKSMEV